MTMLALSRPEPVLPAVRRARPDDEQRILDALTLAFAADPAVRWMYPDPQQYLRYFPRFVKAFGGGAIACGTAVVSEGDAGAALWLPPDTAPDEERLGALLEESLAEREKQDAFPVFEEMAHYHPDQPHWYLPLIGVEPTRQGRGHGSAMLNPRSVRCGRPARLPRIVEPDEHPALPAPRLRGDRPDPDRTLSPHRPDAASGRGMTPRASPTSRRAGPGASSA